jgi:hypothetical protein
MYKSQLKAVVPDTDEKEQYFKVNTLVVLFIHITDRDAIGQVDSRSRSRREAEGVSQKWLGLRSQQGAVEHRLPGVPDPAGAGFGGNAHFRTHGGNEREPS